MVGDRETERGWLYDGVSAVRQPIELSPADGALEVHFDDGRREIVATQDLVSAGTRPGTLLYRRRGHDGWQLALPSPVLPGIGALLPQGAEYGRWIDRIGLGRALAAGLAASLVVLTAAYFLPQWAAPLVPQSWDRRYGEALIGDFGGRFCAGEGGQEALDALAAKLSPDAETMRLRVIDVPMVNAVALPGGNIIVFRELVSHAEGPEEVAGVLAHEIAHVKNRDVTEAMIRQMGFGVVIAGLGGTTGANVDALLASRYSREAEHEADLGALEALKRAGISPQPTAALFSRLAKEEEKLGTLGKTALGYVSTHPMSAERQKLFEDAVDPRAKYAPPLDRDQWAALADICLNDRDPQ